MLAAVTSVRASPSWSISLDANSTGPTDVTVSSSASQSKSFRVGAIINASSAAPLNGVFGWQFSINYNATAFIPQGDPDAASLYPDGAANTALFGAQTASGTVSWAGKIAAGTAFGSSTITHNTGPFQDSITAFFTILAPNPAVNVLARNLLANVNFELLPGHEADPQSFTVSNVVFVDSGGNGISGVIAGPGATESVNNEPPQASFTVSPSPGVFAFTFNSTSFDLDGSIANPGGYFWDFGDGTQDLGETGPVVTHDYGVPGSYTASLRVQDSLGATGSARDSLGSVIQNNQPSHVSHLVPPSVDVPPVAAFTFSPASPKVGEVVTFDASGSFDPDGSIVSYVWDFGDFIPVFSVLPIASHVYSQPGNFTAFLTVTDNASLNSSAMRPVFVGSTLQSLAKVVVDMNPNTAQIENFTAVSGGFNVNVDVLNVTGLYAWQISLDYDNTLLSLSQANVTLGPVWQASLSNGNGFLIIQANQTIGNIVVAFSFVGPVPSFNGNTVLASIPFTPLRMGVGTLRLDPSRTTLVSQPLGEEIPSTKENGVVQVSSAGDEPPVALFTFSPASPAVGETVFFDGRASYDPDGSVQNWLWSFSDFFNSYGPTTYRYFNSPGNYSVSLTVTDNAGLPSTSSMSIVVQPKPAHDVAISFVSASPNVAVSSQTVGIQIAITNKGMSNETVTVATYYDQHVIESVNEFLPSCLPDCTFFTYIFIPWDTMGVPPGNYTISATAFLASDQNPSDNSKTDGQVQILPPPVLQVTPSSGAPGTKVLVQGSGFPQLEYYYGGSIGRIEATFDDQFIGFPSIQDGMFDFTFNVPLSQPGMHLIKAVDVVTGAHSSTSFLVTQPPSNNAFGLSINTGTIYFPGDTAVIYALATLNGSPTGPSGVQLQLILVRPNGSNVTLQATSIAPGLFKATFAVPTTGSVGTYVVLSHIHVTGSANASAIVQDASAIASFEVKPSWLASHGPTVGAIAAVAGVIGVVGVAWRRGYLRKREEDSSFPSLSSH